MATHVAASASRSDIVAALALATNGDTITVPASVGTEVWSEPIVVTDCVTINGAGIGVTVVQAGWSMSSYTSAGMFDFYPDATARAADLPLGCSGFTFDANSESNGVTVKNYAAAPITKVRIHHNRFINGFNATYSPRGIFIIGQVYGVADNNVLIRWRHNCDVNGYNDVSWDNLTVEVGTANQFFFEDNDIESNNSSTVWFAGGHGGRYVVRYNRLFNDSGANVFGFFDIHGNQPSDLCGMMCNEIYGNIMDFGTASGRIIDQRGSTAMVLGNKVVWGGSNPYSSCREEYLDSNYPSGNSYVMHVTNSYYFSNLGNGSILAKSSISSNQYEDTYDLAENVDVWFENQSYNGTTEIGVYVGASLPANCTTGDGAWITNQDLSDLTDFVGIDPTTPISGTFYRATNTDTWTEYYTPYTYPHPLREEEPQLVPNAPTNLTLTAL